MTPKQETRALKRIESIEHYQDKLEEYITKHLDMTDSYKDHAITSIEYLKRGLFWLSDHMESGLEKNDRRLDHFTKRKDELMKLYDFARQTTVPFNYIWFYMLKKLRERKNSLIMRPGVHFIVSLMGGGKSSLMYHTIEKLRHETGLGAYVNVDMEYAHFDELLRIDVKYHNRFEADDYWGAVEDKETKKTKFTQLKRFNKLFPTIVLDEWLSKMNHRMNNTSSYKEIFIPFIRSLAHMRHQGIHRVYVASQLDTTDIQLMSMFKWIHEVEIDLDIPYLEWVKTGSLAKHIKGWQIFTYQVKRQKHKTDKVLIKKWYEKKTMDMTNFNSLNMASEYNDLKYDKIKLERSIT